jgi:hypothetical protein
MVAVRIASAQSQGELRNQTTNTMLTSQFAISPKKMAMILEQLVLPMRHRQNDDDVWIANATPRAGEPGGSFGEDALDPLGKLPRPNPVGGAAGSDPPPFSSEIFGGGRKVPMPEEPASDAPVDHTSQKPEMPEIDEAAEQPATEQPATEEPATEEPAADFLPSEKAPESAADTRTSHTDVLKMQRLAGRTLTHSSSTSKVSSSHTNNKPARWISLPLPAGRVRS